MEKVTKKVVTPASQAFNILDLASASITRAQSLDSINVGESITGTLVNLQQMPPIDGKPVCRIYVHCPEFDVRFNALLDGTLGENISLKNSECDLIFRGINNVRGTKYPKFSVLF
jgi:hypothetical protein